MTEMTEHEAILLDLLLQAIQVDPAHGDANPQIDALMRTVRATALRDAAKDINRRARLDTTSLLVSNWLFDRADAIEAGIP